MGRGRDARDHGLASTRSSRQTTILCGQVKGETRLPMPPLDMGDSTNGKSRISLSRGRHHHLDQADQGQCSSRTPRAQLKQGMQARHCRPRRVALPPPCFFCVRSRTDKARRAAFVVPAAAARADGRTGVSLTPPGSTTATRAQR